MIRTDKRLRLCAVLLICNLAFIWGNSLLPGEVSGAFSDWVKSILAGLFEMGPDDGSGGHLLRKLAHFTEFAALGALLAWRFGMLGKGKRCPSAWERLPHVSMRPFKFSSPAVGLASKTAASTAPAYLQV